VRRVRRNSYFLFVHATVVYVIEKNIYHYL